MQELKIEYLDINDLKPYEGNAKLHPVEQIEQIKRSIETYGMNDPIGVWSDENIVVEGHGRLLACKELGMETVPVIRLDQLSDEQRREYALIHNQTTMNSGFDFSALDEELADLVNFDAEFYGFHRIELTDFFEDDDMQRPSEKPADESVRIIVECENDERRSALLAFLADNNFKYTEL